MKLVSVVILLLLFASYRLVAQIDTVFWMALPDFSASPQNDFMFKFSSYAGTGGGWYNIDFFATDKKGKVTAMLGNSGAMGNWGIKYGTTIDGYKAQYPNVKDWANIAVRIRTPVLSTAFVEIVNSNSSDLYSLKGANGLGTHFIVPFQNRWDNDASSFGAVIDVVAIENNTAVIITPSQNTQAGNAKAKPFAIKLSRGQTYRLKSSSFQAATRLQGTVLKSNKPIAVTITDFEAKYDNGVTDINADQIVPVEVLGQEYILVKGKYEDVNSANQLISLGILLLQYMTIQ